MHKIKKINVSTGIYWVEVEEIGLYILCGSPADTAKHLSRRGFIQTITTENITYESGPNVILLSDMMIQSGEFSNLAEFPVLQMLYRQGMIIPNHPNNTGIKPMLIGSQEQVESQLEYIYRGNYGLTSVQELESCGLDKEKIKELMAIKLKFAFGKIKKSDELLDYKIVTRDNVEIRDGAFIKRLDSNVFEISYEDEKVLIDLNLKKDQSYKPPYTLGYYDIKRGYFSVIHSGSGDGWDVDNPCMASIVMYDGKIYIIDAGPNVLYALAALGIGIEEVEGIFHTHAHDDHFAGISSLIRSDHKIKYFASAPVRLSTVKKLSALLKMREESFYDFFEIIDLKLDVWNDIDGLEVMPIMSPHPIETNLFYFRVYGGDGYRSYCHLADTVSFAVLSKMIKKEPEEQGITQEVFDRVKSSYLRHANIKKIDCGGGMIHGTILDFEKDESDRLIIAHTAIDATDKEKTIGSGAPFGTVDAILQNHTDYLHTAAYNLFKLYFPGMVRKDMSALLNNDIVSINPESIIIREGEDCQHVYFILTGIGEIIHAGKHFQSRITSGTLIGDFFATEKKSIGTYRAVSFMKALKISSKLFLKFLQRNNLHNKFLLLEDMRVYLEQSWLFGESLSFLTQTNIARSITIETLKQDETYIYKDTEYLHIVKSGSLGKYLGEFPVGSVNEDDFFGEDSAVFKEQSIHHIVPDVDSVVYKIPGALLLDIPIIRWKILEIHKKRKGVFF